MKKIQEVISKKINSGEYDKHFRRNENYVKGIMNREVSTFFNDRNFAYVRSQTIELSTGDDGKDIVRIRPKNFYLANINNRSLTIDQNAKMVISEFDKYNGILIHRTTKLQYDRTGYDNGLPANSIIAFADRETDIYSAKDSAEIERNIDELSLGIEPMLVDGYKADGIGFFIPENIRPIQTNKMIVCMPCTSNNKRLFISRRLYKNGEDFSMNKTANPSYHVSLLKTAIDDSESVTREMVKSLGASV